MKSRLAYIGVAFILSFGLFPALTFAETNLSGTISSDRTLTVAESPYIVYTPITVAEGATLFVDPGVIIKFWQNGAIWVYGALKVNGTENNKVYLTSLDDDSVGGDTGGDGNAPTPTPWHGIIFYQNSTGDVSHADIRYGGTYNQNSGWASIANLGTLSVSDSIFTNAPASYAFRQMVGTSTITRTEFGVGVRQAIGIEGGVSDITFSRIHDSIERGLWVKNSTVHLADSVLESIAGDALSVYYSATFTHENNQFLNNYRNGISMWGTLNADTILSDDNGMPYFIDKITVPAGKTFTINPGTIIKFYDRGNVFIEGVMNVLGTKENPVRITSWNDDATIGDSNGDGNATLPSARDWQSLTVLAGGQLTMTHADVAYGGGQGYFYANWPSVGNEGGTINIDFAAFHDNTVGVNNDAGQSTIRNSSFKNNNIGAYLAYGSLSVQNSSFVGNGQGVGTYYNSVDVADAINNWWGDASGPSNYTNNPSGTGDGVADRVNFTPWLTSQPGIVTPPVNTCCSSVLFLPGFMASDLYVQGALSENQLWPPNSLLKSDVEKLMLDSSGNPITTGIYTKGVISETFGINIYKSFLEKMDNLVGSNLIKEFEAFPYDWRKDVPEVVTGYTTIKIGNNFESKKLVDEAIALAGRSKTGKITIIGHSNGGLVGKYLIKELDSRGLSNLVDQFVMVATPQVGTPKALAGLLHGDEEAVFFGLLLDKQTAVLLGKNMISAFNLLPSSQYFAAVNDPVITFDDSINKVFGYSLYGNPQNVDDVLSMSTFVTSYSRGVNKGEPTNIPSVLSSELVEKANQTVGMLVGYSIPKSINSFQVAGFGVPTIKTIKYQSKQETVCATQSGLYSCGTQSFWDRRLLKTEGGDGTVLEESATNQPNTITYYLNLQDLNNQKLFNLKHAQILEAGSLLDLVGQIIGKDISALPQDYITKEKPISHTGGLVLSVHSPVSLGITDSHGLYTGLSRTSVNPDGFSIVEEKVPNSSYEEIDDEKYIDIPSDGTYTVSIQGEGSGTFTFNQENVSEGEILSSKSFVNLPVTPLLRADLFINQGVLSDKINIDTDGNGKVDLQIQASSEFDPVSYLTVMKSVIKTFGLKKEKESELTGKINNLMQLIQKGKISKASAKASVMVKNLNKNLAKINKSKMGNKHQKLTQEEIQIMIKSLEELILNLK